MAESLGSIYAEITLRTSRFARDAARVKAQIRDLDGAMNGLAARAAGLGAAFNRIIGPISAVASMVSRTMALVSSVTSAVALKTAMDFNAMAESAEIGFEQMLGSAERARQFMDDLFRLARESPLDFPGVLQGARRFLALGIAAEDVVPALKTVTDAVGAMGGSTEMLNRVTMAIGQIATKGRVQMEELLQLAEAGIPVFEILREKLGLTQEQLQRIGAEGIGAGEALRALFEGLAERYGGQAERQARSLGGALATLKDNIQMILGMTFRPLTDRIRDAVLRVNELAEQFIAAYRAGGLLAGLRAILPERAFQLFARAIMTVQAALQRLAGMRSDSQSLLEALGQMALWAAQAFYVLAEAVRWIMDNWPAIRTAIINVATAFASWFIITRIIGLISNLIQALRNLNAAIIVSRVLALALRAPWVALAGAVATAVLQITGALDYLRGRLWQWLEEMFPDVEIPDIELPPLDTGADQFQFRPDAFSNLPSGAQASAVAGAARDPLSDLMDQIRRRIQIAQARADVALQTLRLSGVSEESARYLARQREVLMQVYRTIQDGMERLRAAMARWTGERRERAELELLQLQREANDILLEIRENTKALRPTFGLPLGIEPMRLFQFRAMQAGTRGVTITNPTFVFQMSGVPTSEAAWRQGMAGFPEALARMIESAMAQALNRQAMAGAGA